jgi:hypothetical protein
MAKYKKTKDPYAEARKMTKRMSLPNVNSKSGFTEAYGSLGGPSKMTKAQRQALNTAMYSAAAPVAGAGVDALTSYVGGDIDSSGEAFGRGALKGATQGALSGAGIGSSIAPGVGTVIGAAVGFIGGGLMEGLSSQKQYEEYKKVKKAQEKAQRFQRTEAQAAARRMSGGQSAGMNYRPETIEGVDAELGSGLSSFDAYKATRYGG